MAPRAGAPDRVALFHGWAESPVWYRTSGDFGPVDLAALPISKELRDALVAWNDFAGATLSANDNERPDEDVESEHTATGSRLAEGLRRELGIEVISRRTGTTTRPARAPNHWQIMPGSRTHRRAARPSDLSSHPEDRVERSRAARGAVSPSSAAGAGAL